MQPRTSLFALATAIAGAVFVVARRYESAEPDRERGDLLFTVADDQDSDSSAARLAIEDSIPGEREVALEHEEARDGIAEDPEFPGEEEVKEELLEAGAFELVYDSMSVRELEQEYEDLDEKIQVAVADAYQIQFETGHYEVVGYGKEVTADMQDRHKLTAYQLVEYPGQEDREIRRVELLESEYPDVYALHRRAVHIVDTIRHKQRSRGRDR